MKMPTYDQLMEPTLKALESLGGSGSIEEITDEVIQLLNLPEAITSQLHKPEQSNRTELDYRLAWTRTYLKKSNLIENSARGIWAFTKDYRHGQKINVEQIVHAVNESRSTGKKSRKKIQRQAPPPQAIIGRIGENEVEIEDHWRDLLHQALIKMSPDSFERLTKRLLRESGFVQVEVIGRTGDGGIDGKGILKLQNVISYHVVFQCKRYKGSVGSGAIRDFRGAMVGRADKGIFITTGTFTRDAITEATRDGAPAIDLIDGDNLAEMLKNLNLGVNVRMVEHVEVDGEWFERI